MYTSMDEIYIEVCESYQKRSLRNKCIILGANGPITLTIPLNKGKHSFKLITEVEISYHDQWVGHFLHTIRSCYGTAPYFDFYYPDIEDLIKSNYKYLWNLNNDMLSLILRKIGLDIDMYTTKDFIKSYDDSFVDIRQKKIKDYQPIRSTTVVYSQVFEDRFGFVSNLSILDLLFCTGPESINYLTQVSKYK